MSWKAVFAKRGALSWPLLGLLGIVAVVAGVNLPQVMNTSDRATEPAPAATSETKSPLAYTPPSLPDAPSAKSMLTRLGLGTFLVLALCVGTLWVGKRWLRVPSAGTGAGSHLKVIETLPLGGRCLLYLVSAGNKQILVGVDSGGLKTLMPLPEPFENALDEARAEEPDLGLKLIVPGSTRNDAV